MELTQFIHDMACRKHISDWCRSVGVQGDQRTHSHVVALRAVTSSDGMTADWYPFEPDFLRAVSTRICNQVRSVNRVVYDVTSKPPGTIEWE